MEKVPQKSPSWITREWVCETLGIIGRFLGHVLAMVIAYTVMGSFTYWQAVEHVWESHIQYLGDHVADLECQNRSLKEELSLYTMDEAAWGSLEGVAERRAFPAATEMSDFFPAGSPDVAFDLRPVPTMPVRD